MSLAGKRVAIIGGASGIGFAVAQLAQAQGGAVIIGSSGEGNVKAAVGRLAGATGHTVDVRDEGSVRRFFDQVGAFDHLVLTAGDWGGLMMRPTADIDITAAQQMLAVRFWGVIAAAKHAIRTIAPDGSITLTGGLLAHRPLKGAPLATALGGAVESLARGLAVDLAPVRVNAVSPGLILTEHVTTQMPPEMIAAFTAALPLPRAATPAEAARAYVYLMLNSYVTGQILPVDGGALLV